jgi:hypothetical protein
MPVTPTKNRTCNTYGKPKDRFDTKADAAARRDQMIDSGRYAEGSLGAYPCKHCAGFHVGHRRIDASTRGGRRGGGRSGGRRQGGRR